MISYCVAVLRPWYAKTLIDELVAKTTVPYEILLWLNTGDADFHAFIVARQAQDVPIRVVGDTPENIGMFAYKELFQAARYEIITQIDDDVTRISRGMAEGAGALFGRHPKLYQVVADVWQDEFTTGSRPPLAEYQVISETEGLYDGLVDGWFSMYRREMLPVLMAVPYKKYEFIGSWANTLLRTCNVHGWLCTQMKVFHVTGPAYALLFGQLENELAKYRRVNRMDIVEAYEKQRATLPPVEVLQQSLAHAYREIDRQHLRMTLLG